MIRSPLAERDVDAVELMDDPDCDPVVLERTYAQFRTINAVVSGWRATYRRFIRPQLSTTVPTRLLDIGSGGGDLPRMLARWAVLDGLRLSIVAIDPDPRAHDFAVSLPRMRGLEFRAAFSSELVTAGEQFDLVTSNHILHHLTSEQLGGLLFDSERLVEARSLRLTKAPHESAGSGASSRSATDPPRVLHGDITRGALAYAGFRVGTIPFFPGSFIRHDGMMSIRRSFTPDELRALVPNGWRVRTQGPFRFLLTWSPDA